jgi:hypothetical protein
MDHPNTIDRLHFRMALPFTGAIRASPRRRRAKESG